MPRGCAGARFACNACLNFLAGLGISEPISPGWAAMERLSGLDAFFLYMETPSQPLNVCCVLELDTSTMPGGYTYGRFHAALEKYVKAAPEFRMKLADTELNLDHPVWVDDDNFQIRHHLRRVAMPAPGGRRELAEICGYIAGLPLDRDRPLWEMWVIEGGARSDTVAVMLKVHHAVVDGVAGANLLSHLCSLQPDAPAPQPVRGTGGGNVLQIAASGLVGFASRPVRLATVVPATVLTLVRTLLRAREGRTMAAPFSAPPTPFNGPLGRLRNIAYTQLDMRDVKRVKDRFGVTINDVVVACVPERYGASYSSTACCPRPRWWPPCRFRYTTSRTDPGATRPPGCSVGYRARSATPPSASAPSPPETPSLKTTPRPSAPPCCTTGFSSAARRCSERPCGSCRTFR